MTKEEQLRKAAEEYAENNNPFKPMLNRSGEEVIQRVGQNAPGSKKHQIQSGKIKKAFIAGATSEAAKEYWQGWVSVETELPEIGEYVLVYNTEGATLVARCLNNGWAAFFADGEKLMGELKAVAWQPLPSPPKTDK